MGDAPRLKPCPFCGGTDIECEELGYNALGHHICRDCDASGPTSEKTVANSAKAWNCRAQSEGQAKVVEARRQAIEECAKVCEQKLLVFDGCGDVKIGVEMAGKLLVHAIRALTPIGDSSGEGGGR